MSDFLALCLNKGQKRLSGCLLVSKSCLLLILNTITELIYNFLQIFKVMMISERQPRPPSSISMQLWVCIVPRSSTKTRAAKLKAKRDREILAKKDEKIASLTANRDRMEEETAAAVAQTAAAVAQAAAAEETIAALRRKLAEVTGGTSEPLEGDR